MDELNWDSDQPMPADDGVMLDEILDTSSQDDDLSITSNGVAASPDADVKSMLAELKSEREQLRMERTAYQQAIQQLRPQPADDKHEPLTTEELDEVYRGKSGYDIIRDLASKQAREIVEQEIRSRGLDTAKETQDALVRHYQLTQAQEVYPDLPKYKDKLIMLSRRMEEKMGREAAMNFSVLELMHMLKGNEKALQRSKPKDASQQRQSTLPNNAAIRRAGTNPNAVNETSVPGSMAEAFQRAKKLHGIPAGPGEYRVPAQLNSPI